MFTDAANHAIVARRVTVAGLGDAAKFQAGDREIRFNFRFDRLEAQPGAKPIQRGTCTLPDGQTLRFVVNDEKGAATPDGTFRVFAGLRSDPFILAWLVGELKPFQNLLEHDNVLCFLVDFDTKRVLDPAQGSLFGVIAETTPVPERARLRRTPVAALRLGRAPGADQRAPEQRADCRAPTTCATSGISRRRSRSRRSSRRCFASAWSTASINTTCATARRTGRRRSSPRAPTCFSTTSMLIDVAKPTTDTSYLEIEKSTLNGRPYQTGGGRTLNAHDIDMLLTWIVNRDREPLRGRCDARDAAWPQHVSLSRAAEHRIADGGRIGGRQCVGREGLGADRRLRRDVASADRAASA